MRRLAIITARGGSKRIPHKNIKDFLGKPMLSYSIEAAFAAGIFDEVMVSTDDKDIERIAKEAGAKVPFLRSEETSGDFATTADVVREVVETYREKGEVFDQICCIYPTAPFLKPERLREAMDILTKEDADTVFPVVAFSFPPQRAVVIKEGNVVARWPEFQLQRSQDLEKLYHDVGQFYALSSDRFQEQKQIIMEHSIPLILSELEVQDIDTFEDWEMAELKYQMLQKRQK